MAADREVGAVPDEVKPLAYNSLWQLRNDGWSSLEEIAAQLVLAGAQQRPADRLVHAATELLNVLGPIERFWAFPGTQTFQRLRRLFASGRYDRFAALARHAVVLDIRRPMRRWQPAR